MANLTDNQKEAMRKLFEENGLVKEDVFNHKHYIIIKRSGIEKIQYKNKINVTFDVINSDRDFCIVKAKTDKLETLASATPENCQNKHYVEMAEKRALSRIVLKTIEAYELGCFGEDENYKDE